MWAGHWVKQQSDNYRQRENAASQLKYCIFKFIYFISNRAQKSQIHIIRNMMIISSLYDHRPITVWTDALWVLCCQSLCGESSLSHWHYLILLFHTCGTIPLLCPREPPEAWVYVLPAWDCFTSIKTASLITLRYSISDITLSYLCYVSWGFLGSEAELQPAPAGRPCGFSYFLFP